ncbi:DUF2268 domain-containing putative Zn-dependent protease [Paracoccus solventivorans]|nr:DUF2268 domain-containing putative Zn-dependent protease [Paracoccus solventivorans]
MPYWQVHFLNARHALTSVMPEIRAAVAESVALVSAHAELPDFDVVVRAEEGIPDWGVLAHSPAPGVVELALAPSRFDSALVVRRMVRALFLILRGDHPGYGRSLGEALVSEGLAGHFVQAVLGGRPDPWDATPLTAGVAKRAMTEWAWLDYDRALWFEGRGNIRKWAGYGLAHRLVAEHLARSEGVDVLSLAAVSAEALRPAMRRLSGADTEPEVEADAEPGDGPAPEPETAEGEAPEQGGAAPVTS